MATPTPADPSIRFRMASIVAKEEDQKATQSPSFPIQLMGQPLEEQKATQSPSYPIQFMGQPLEEQMATQSPSFPIQLIGQPFFAHGVPSDVLQQQAMQSMSSSPSTLSQHVHAYSHVGKTKSGSNSGSSVGSQNGSSNSGQNASSSAPTSQGHVLPNGPAFPNAMFNATGLLAGPLAPAVAPGGLGSPVLPTAMAAMAHSSMPHGAMPFGAMLPASLQPAPAEIQVTGASQAGVVAPGGTYNSASSSSISYPSGGNSGGSNSSDTRTQLSSGDSEEVEDAGANGGEGRKCRRTARREYHKKIERKRRDRMRMLYEKLRSLTDLSEVADKNGVLEGAIALIQDLKQQNQELLARVALVESTQCSSSSTGDCGSTGDSREGSVASSEADRESKRTKTAR